MAGYKKAGVDLDTLLEPWQSGDGNAAATGYKIAGADLNTKYAPASAGTGYTGGTNFQQANADIGPRFCAKGTRWAPLAINGGSFHGDSSGNISSAMTGQVTVAINAAGTYSVNCVGNNVATTPASGTWLPSGHAASEYQVQFAVTTNSTYTNGGATVTNSAAAYAACTANQSCQFTAGPVGQTSAQDKGGTYTLAINLKRIADGVVKTTTIAVEVESVGSG